MSKHEEHRLEFLAYHAFACIVKVELMVSTVTNEDAELANAAIRDNLEKAFLAVSAFAHVCRSIFKERTGIDMAEPRDAGDVVAEIMARGD